MAQGLTSTKGERHMKGISIELLEGSMIVAGMKYTGYTVLDIEEDGTLLEGVTTGKEPV